MPQRWLEIGGLRINPDRIIAVDLKAEWIGLKYEKNQDGETVIKPDGPRHGVMIVMDLGVDFLYRSDLFKKSEEAYDLSHQPRSPGQRVDPGPLRLRFLDGTPEAHAVTNFFA